MPAAQFAADIANNEGVWVLHQASPEVSARLFEGELRWLVGDPDGDSDELGKAATRWFALAAEVAHAMGFDFAIYEAERVGITEDWTWSTPLTE